MDSTEPLFKGFIIVAVFIITILIMMLRSAHKSLNAAIKDVAEWRRAAEMWEKTCRETADMWRDDTVCSAKHRTELLKMCNQYFERMNFFEQKYYNIIDRSNPDA